MSRLPIDRADRQAARQRIGRLAADEAMRNYTTIVCSEGDCDQCKAGPGGCLDSCHDPRDEPDTAQARCAKCGNALATCTDCGKPAQCGEPWCATHSPDGDWGTALIRREDA